MTAKERRNIVGRILEDVSNNMYNYHEFVLDCVESVVNNWDDKELLKFIGDSE